MRSFSSRMPIGTEKRGPKSRPLMATLLVLMAVSVSAQSDWPTYQYNAQHIGYNPLEKDLVPPLELKWSRELCSEELMPATIVGDRIYLGMDEARAPDTLCYLWCLDLATGLDVWTLPMGGLLGMVPQPSYAYGVLYAQSTYHYLYSFVAALTPDSGHIIWQTGYPSQTDVALAPTVYNGRVVICGNYYMGTHCFDAYDGQIRWKSSLQDFDEWCAAIYDDVVYTFEGWRLELVDLMSGQWLGRTNLHQGWNACLKEKSIIDPGNAPVIDTVRGIIYCTSNESIHAVDLETLEELWFRNGECGYRATPALYDGKVYSIQEGKLMVLDGLTGDSLGVFVPIPRFRFLQELAPVIANGYLYVSSNYSTYALDVETLELVWQHPYIGGELAVGNGHLIVSGPTGEVHAFGNLATDADDNDAPSLPESVALHQNYPNPFNTGTVINYDLPTRSHVEISVYNILGQQVVTLVDQALPAGQHTVGWDGNDQSGRPVASGIYLYSLKTSDLNVTKKMVLMK